MRSNETNACMFKLRAASPNHITLETFLSNASYLSELSPNYLSPRYHPVCFSALHHSRCRTFTVISFCTLKPPKKERSFLDFLRSHAFGSATGTLLLKTWQSAGLFASLLPSDSSILHDTAGTACCLVWDLHFWSLGADFHWWFWPHAFCTVLPCGGVHEKSSSKRMGWCWTPQVQVVRGPSYRRRCKTEHLNKATSSRFVKVLLFQIGWFLVALPDAPCVLGPDNWGLQSLSGRRLLLKKMPWHPWPVLQLSGIWLRYRLGCQTQVFEGTTNLDGRVWQFLHVWQ